MKDTRKKFSETKTFYVCLCVGLFGVLVVAAMQNRQKNQTQEYSLADLNEPAVENPIAKATELPDTGKQTAQDTQEKENKTQTENTSESTMAEQKKKEVKANEEKSAQAKADNQDKKAKEETVAVISNQNKSTFSFDEEKGLLWPVTGELLMKYNMDSGVYFKTLGQYKCNPAILIGGKAGDEVYSAAAGKVTDIKESPETGVTVTMDIGNDYELIYGQLGNLKVKKGDTLKEGEVLGTLEEPTRYYVEEGCNLYFEVHEKGEPVDPMLLLR